MARTDGTAIAITAGMHRHHDDHEAAGAVDAPGAARAPGKASLTQRMARGTPAPPDTPERVAVQRAIDPVTAAVQRARLARDLSAAFDFTSPAAVQRKVDAHTGLDDGAIADHAARGVSGAGGVLPHLEAIQRSFGPAHDLSGVRAHVGGAAADASAAIGAHAYATGNDVAFASSPDLFLAAHEATHIVQQRQGVSLKGAVGQDGDAYEQHADTVAAAVVRGEDVSAMLGGGSGGGGSGAVQRLSTHTAAPQYLKSATLDGSAYLCPTATAPATYENKFGGTAESSVLIPDGYHGVIRIHLDGHAEISALTGIYFNKLDLVAIWNADYRDDKLTLRWDPSMFSSLDDEVVLDVDPDQDSEAYAGHPGSVTLRVTPRRPSSLGEFPVGIGPVSVNVGDSSLRSLEFKVRLFAHGQDPSLKPAPAPAATAIHNDNRRYTTVTTPPAQDAAPPLPSDVAYPYEVRFKREGDTVPTDSEIQFLDTFLGDAEAFNRSLQDSGKPTVEHWYKLRVTGHASNTARPAVDRAVALKRASWVRDYASTTLGLVADTDAVVASKGHKESELADKAASTGAESHDASADYVDKRAVMEFVRK